MQQAYNRVRFVLVSPAQPGNIGGAARAIKNMGFAQLVLVQPQIFPSDRARWRAAGAADILEQARVVESFDEAIADCQLVIGTSARERRIPWPLIDPAQCGQQVAKESQQGEVALVFGREDSGLTNEELQRCQMHVHIPTSPVYSSLNLSAAVQVLAYEVRKGLLGLDPAQLAVSAADDEPPASAADLENMLLHFEEVMVQSGFLDPNNPRQTVTRLRRMMNRIRPDQSEVAILRGFLSSVDSRPRK